MVLARGSIKSSNRDVPVFFTTMRQRRRRWWGKWGTGVSKQGGGIMLELQTKNLEQLIARMEEREKYLSIATRHRCRKMCWLSPCSPCYISYVPSTCVFVRICVQPSLACMSIEKQVTSPSLSKCPCERVHCTQSVLIKLNKKGQNENHNLRLVLNMDTDLDFY